MDTSRPAHNYDQSRQKYHHEALISSRHFRLIRISPNEIPNAPISITLEQFHIDRAPEYQALSYTWGKATREIQGGDVVDIPELQVSNIEVGDQGCTLATPNLHDVLSQFRNEEAGYLWVDALCIDQTNILEREAQILLMGEIYSRADRVLVWLGKSDEDVKAVLFLLNRWCPLVEDSDVLQEIDSAVLDALGLSLDEWFNTWEDCSQFFIKRAWFHRAWVIQEYTLAKEITIRCGSHTLPTVDLVRLSKQAGRTSDKLQRHITNFYMLQTLRSDLVGKPDSFEENCLLFGAKTLEQQWYSTAVSLVMMCCHYQTTVPHDKLYSIIGVANRYCPQPNDFQLLVAYRRPAEEVFLHFFAQAVRNLPICALLSFVEGIELRNRHSLPSWCPDFRISWPSNWNPLISLNTTSSGSVEDGSTPLHFNAMSYLLSDKGSVRLDGQILTLSAKLIGRVVEKTLPFENLLWPDSNTDLKPYDLFEICSKMDDQYVLTQESRIRVLVQTLGAGNGIYHLQDISPDALGPDLLLQPFRTWYLLASAFYLRDMKLDTPEAQVRLGAMQFWSEELSTSEINLPSAAEVTMILSKLKKELNQDEDSQPSSEFIDSMNDANEMTLKGGGLFFGRTLFLTDQKWLGLGPKAIEPNDELWLLKATPIPFILRPAKNGMYTLVGEAYVHGIMQGELIDAPGGTEGFVEVQLI